MSDLGLLMTDAMALACHERRKTVTRRPMSPQPEPATAHPACRATWQELATRTGPAWRAFWHTPKPSGGEHTDWGDIHSPTIPGAGTAKVGGRVWVRECWADYGLTGAGEPWRVAYRTGGFLDLPRCHDPDHTGTRCWRWRPSIHMPKWACRTWGRIVSVRPERLQDITDDDAQREGFTEGFVACGMLPHVAAFRSVWNDCYANRGLGWNANPWVWRIEWERIERPTLAGVGSAGVG